MSRALLVMAFARALGRPPTDAEREEYLAALAEVAGGCRVYIPISTPVDEDSIRALHAAGMSVRKIAKKLGCSKSRVGMALRQPDLLGVQNPALNVDREAA